MTDEKETGSETEREAYLLVASVKDYAIFALDPRGYVKSWNPGARAVKQYEASEIIGQHFSRFYTPEDVQAGRPWRLLKIADEEGRVEDEGWRVRKDGSRFWADVVITAIRNEAGELVGYAKVTRDLTERRKAEEALRRSEESLATTLYSIGDGVIATDEQALVTRLNPVAERLTGWTQSEAVGRPVEEVFNIVNEETRARAENPVHRVIAEGIVVGLANHTALIDRAGIERPIADSGAPIRDAAGMVRGAVLVFRDVTEEKKAEEALRQSEEKLRLMIASVHDYALFMLDPEGRVASWNPGAERIMGYRAPEILGNHFSKFYPQEDLSAGKPARELEVAGRIGRFEDEGWRVRRDGSPFWANTVLSAIRDDRGQLVGFTKVTRDMTERKRAELEIARQAVRQEAVAELGIAAISTRDLQPLLDKAVMTVTRTLDTASCGVFERWTEGRSLLLRAGHGWEGGQVGLAEIPADRGSPAGLALLTGEPVLSEDLPADRRFTVPPLLKEVGARSVLSVVIPGPGGEPPFGALSTHTTTSRFFTRDEVNFVRSIAHVIATVITRKRNEDHLRMAEMRAEEERQRTARAQEALRERDIFLAVAAHELRTPLTALQLKLQVLQQVVGRELAGTAQAERSVRRFDDALRQTGRLSELVERMLDVSRIAVGRLEMQPEPLDLEPVIRDVIRDYREKALEAQTEIHFTARGDLHGEWDRHRLEQVAHNLLSNAVKYGNGKPIAITLEGMGDEVRLSVADRGIGIAERDVDRIFAPFERAVPVEHFAGMGLGLFLTRHIVEAHGGTIQVSSVPGEGATFLVVLPRSRKFSRGADQSARGGEA